MAVGTASNVAKDAELQRVLARMQELETMRGPAEKVLEARAALLATHMPRDLRVKVAIEQAEWLRGDKRYGEALKFFRQALANGFKEHESVPGYEASQLAQCLIETGHKSEALALLNRMIADPKKFAGNSADNAYRPYDAAVELLGKLGHKPKHPRPDTRGGVTPNAIARATEPANAGSVFKGKTRFIDANTDRFSWEGIKTLAQEAHITDRRTLLAAMPLELTRDFAMEHTSEARRGKCVTPQYPRAVLSTSAKLGPSKAHVLTFNGNPADGCQDVEYTEHTHLVYNDRGEVIGGGRSLPHLIRFDKNGQLIEFVDDPNVAHTLSANEKCAGCHTDDWKGKWTAYPVWPNAYGALDDKSDEQLASRSPFDRDDREKFIVPPLSHQSEAEFNRYKAEWTRPDSIYSVLAWDQRVSRPNFSLTTTLSAMAEDRALRRWSTGISKTGNPCALSNTDAPNASKLYFQRASSEHVPFTEELDLSPKPDPTKEFFDGEDLTSTTRFCHGVTNAMRTQREKALSDKATRADIVSERCTTGGCHEESERKQILTSPKLLPYLRDGKMPADLPPGTTLNGSEIRAVLFANPNF